MNTLSTLFWVSAGLATAFALSTSASATPSGADLELMPLVRAVAAEAGLDSDWQDFLALTAYRESKGNPASKNAKPGEAAAAATSYERNEHRFEDCGYPAESYTFGSGGLYGFLPSVGVSQLGEQNWCTNPNAVFDPRKATAMAIGFARGLMRYAGFKKLPTRANLRLMWGSPRSGANYTKLANARPALNEEARELGIDPRWLDGKPTPITFTAQQALERMGVA